MIGGQDRPACISVCERLEGCHSLWCAKDASNYRVVCGDVCGEDLGFRVWAGRGGAHQPVHTGGSLQPVVRSGRKWKGEEGGSREL